MKILEIYLWKNLIVSILITWVALVSLDTFFNYLAELNNTDPETDYGSLQALTYVAYMIPRSLYSFFPIATLIGALMGLGQLAASSEFIAMYAAGISIKRIMLSVLKLGLITAILIFAFGEWITPITELKAKSFKIEKQEKSLAYTPAGVWVKEGNQFIHVDKAWSNDKFSGVSIYQIDIQKGRLTKIIKAEDANKLGNKWHLHKVLVKSISDDGIDISRHNTLLLNKLVSEKFINIASVEAEHLSARELSKFIQHQDNNDLNTVHLEQAYWQRFSLPLSTLVMLIIAMPFAFGAQRNAGAGQRLFIGILIGIVFILINRAASSMGVVYGFSPILSTFTPLLLFLSMGLFMLRRIK